MRVNVYAEEMTDRVELVEKEGYIGLRFYLYLPVTTPDGQVRGPFRHKPETYLSELDDDSSAVTFWGKRDLRDNLRRALALLERHYGQTGEAA